MVNEDSNYKRIEDQKWRESVETRLVLLTSAQKKTDDHLDKLDGELEEVDQLLEGDPLKRNDSGLKGDVEDNNRAINALRAIMAPDALGHGGVKRRLEDVEVALGLRISRSENHWKVLLAIIGATATITTAVVMNIDRIEVLAKHFWNHSTVSESRPQRKRSGKTNRRRQRPAVIEAPTGATDGDQEGVSEGRSGADSSHQ